jgi:hypothetical protein
MLDDHYEAWFLSFPQPPTQRPEGFESVIDLGLSQEWLSPPKPLDDENAFVAASGAPNEKNQTVVS